ncbi:Up-regulated during septation-domain-containing protein [Podospora conica]|nr:Up-regulated during septation-domain-containing protein [Schizothecium conicum]
MNGAATRRGEGFGSATRLPPSAGPPMPNGKVLVDSYREDTINGLDREKPRSNPANRDRPQSSPLVDLNDPIQVHLLTETALSDSRQYEILSQEEVDDLKKQIQSLSMRIEQARANLAIHSKYRDAAISMAKLYSPKPEGKRLSLRGNRQSDSAKEADMERQASEKRCEELAAELFTLEKRIMEPQRRLLQHTAAILQMTHRASAKKTGQLQVGQPLPSGIPGSPESLYTYTNARNSLDVGHDGIEFDDRSLYLPLEQMSAPPIPTSRQRKNTIEIPMKSPIREQANQLREEMDRVKEENARLKVMENKFKAEEENLRGEEERLRANERRLQDENAQLREEKARLEKAEERLTAQLGAESDTLQTQTAEQMRLISETELKLESLNSRLREVIIGFGIARTIDVGEPKKAAGTGETLRDQLEFLDKNLYAAKDEQVSYTTNLYKENEVFANTAAAAEAALAQAEGRVEDIIDQLRDLMQRSKTGGQLPPTPANGLLDLLAYLNSALSTVGNDLLKAAESAALSSRQNSEQVETVLAGLWDIIQAGLAEAQQQKSARRQARLDKGLEPDEEDMSGDETADPNEPYSLSAFSAKVQWLFTQATSLKEQKGVLKRQIKQQRELNNKSDVQKDAELKASQDALRAKDAELDQTHALLDETEKSALETREKLNKALGDMERMQKSSASDAALKDQLQASTTRLATLEAEIAEIEGSYKDAQTQLAAATAAAADLRRELDERTKDVADKDDELDRMNTMVIELKTEVAIAKAELDGAYGSRKQRAAEVARLAQSSEVEELGAQVARLKAELAATLRDLEDITRDSIKAEREKMELEGRLDDAEAARQAVEAEAGALRAKLDGEVGRLREELDKERLKPPASPGVGGGRAGAAMLSEQFRATMKEERKKFQEELREEQARRRKLEDEMRSLRRQAGPGRSPLGPLSPR